MNPAESRVLTINGGNGRHAGSIPKAISLHTEAAEWTQSFQPESLRTEAITVGLPTGGRHSGPTSCAG